MLRITKLQFGISLFLLLIFQAATTSDQLLTDDDAQTHDESSFFVEPPLEVHESFPQSYYGLTGLEHFLNGEWKASAYAYLKDIGKPMNKPYESFIGLSRCYEKLLDFNQAFNWSFKALKEQPTLEWLQYRTDYLRTRLSTFQFNSFTHCFDETFQKDKSEIESIDIWLQGVYIRQLPETHFPSFISQLPFGNLECLLNSTIPLDGFFINFDFQIRFFLNLQYFDKAQRIIQLAFDQFPFAKTHFQQIQLLSFIFQSKYNRALELSNQLIQIDSQDTFATLMKLSTLHRSGEHRQVEKVMMTFWKKQLRRWLQETPKLNCKRSISFDWFSDSNVIISKPINFLPLIEFGEGDAFFIEDDENSQSKNQRALFDSSLIVNNSFVDKSAFVLKIENVELFGNYQLITDCRRFVLFNDEDNLMPTQPSQSVQLASLDRIAITNPRQNDGYHNQIESMSRLVILIYEVLSKHDDVYLMMDELELTADLLELLKVPIERVISFEPEKFHYQIKELYFVDWKRPNNTKANDYAIHHHAPPRWALHILRQWLWEGIARVYPQAKGKNPGSIDIIYVTSAVANNPGTYLVVDEFRLISELRQACEKIGAHLSVHSGFDGLVAETADKFRSADLVVGPHGPGLANILFSSIGSTVIEFPLLNAKNWNYYGYLASALGIDYWIVPEMSTTYRTKYPLDRSRIQAIIDTIEIALEIKGLL